MINFDLFFKQFAQSKWAKNMQETVENSPWHREASVFTHTEMCIDFYKKNIAPHRTQHQQLITLLALCMHDVGKPEAEETLERKDGSGVYRRYAGHEQISANEFISFWCSEQELTQPFMKSTGITWKHIQAIKFMIQNHLPFGLKNTNKRNSLKLALQSYLGSDEVCFYDMLISDANGRISDDHEVKLENVYRWINEFKQIIISGRRQRDTTAEMVILIGASGSGKSTYLQRFNAPHANIISLDTFRLEFAALNFASKVADSSHNQLEFTNLSTKEQYTFAWEYCNKFKSDFSQFVAKRAVEIVKNSGTIWVDNVNATKKSRAQWTGLAHRVGLSVSTVEFYNAETTLHSRQYSRVDKYVPSLAVHQQFLSQMVPNLGTECHYADICTPW